MYIFISLLSNACSAIQQAAWILPWLPGLPCSPVLQGCPASQAHFPTTCHVPCCPLLPDIICCLRLAKATPWEPWCTPCMHILRACKFRLWQG